MRIKLRTWNRPLRTTTLARISAARHVRRRDVQLSITSREHVLQRLMNNRRVGILNSAPPKLHLLMNPYCVCHGRKKSFAMKHYLENTSWSASFRFLDCVSKLRQRARIADSICGEIRASQIFSDKVIRHHQVVVAQFPKKTSSCTHSRLFIMPDKFNTICIHSLLCQLGLQNGVDCW